MSKCVYKYIFFTIDSSCNMLLYIMYMFYKLILTEEIRFLWATFQVFCSSKSINWRNLIQYYRHQVYNVACFTFMCLFAQSIFFLLKVWLQLAVNQLSHRFCLLLDIKVLIFCLINKWSIMGPTHFILWLNLFNLFTANGECWLWSNSGWLFNSRGLNRPDSQKPYA